MTQKPQRFSEASLNRMKEVHRRVLTTRPAQKPLENPSQGTPDWRHGIIKGAVQSAGGFMNAFAGGSLGAVEWLAVGLLWPNGNALVPVMSGSITSFTQSGSSPTVLGVTGDTPPNGWFVIVAGTPGGVLDGIWGVANSTPSTFTLQGTDAGSGAVPSGDDVTTSTSAHPTGSWMVGVPVANFDSTFSGVAGTYCRVKFGFGQWVPDWAGCGIAE